MAPKPFPLSLAQLSQVLGVCAGQVVGPTDVLCCGATQDSRRVHPGTLFAVRSGQKSTGLSFVQDALARGAAALLIEEAAREPVQALAPGIALLVVNDVAAALGPLAHALWGFPSQHVAVSGITGTNGKTTVAVLLRQCFTELGLRAASLGTLGYQFEEVCDDFGMTTPPADVVAQYLAAARAAGAQELVMEVSSHALSQFRVEGVRFQVAGYTNFSQDHLDYHGTLEEYALSKAKLFDPARSDNAVLNLDDAHIQTLAQRLRPVYAQHLLSVGADPLAQLRLTHQTARSRSTAFEVTYRDEGYAFETSLMGAHNVSNWLVVLGMLVKRGITLKECQAIVPRVVAAPGRLERCDADDDDISVYVDYAHTPDALERALAACRELTTGKLWCVFGCGGDRDRTKRPKMGAAAVRLADHVVLTNDNPRTEAPQAIAHDVLTAIPASAHPAVILDRKSAIEHAVGHAQSGDLVLIAGKGHESYQIFGHTKTDFDDRRAAKVALSQRRASKAREAR